MPVNFPQPFSSYTMKLVKISASQLRVLVMASLLASSLSITCSSDPLALLGASFSSFGLASSSSPAYLPSGPRSLVLVLSLALLIWSFSPSLAFLFRPVPFDPVARTSSTTATARRLVSPLKRPLTTIQDDDGARLVASLTDMVTALAANLKAERQSSEQWKTRAHASEAQCRFVERAHTSTIVRAAKDNTAIHGLSMTWVATEIEHKAAIEKFEEKVEGLETEVEATRVELTDARVTIQELRQTVARLSVQIEEQRDELDVVQEELDEAVAAKEATEKEALEVCTEMQKQVKKKEAALAGEKNTVRGMESEIEELEEEVGTWKVRSIKAAKDLAASEKVNAALREEIAALRAEVASRSEPAPADMPLPPAADDIQKEILDGALTLNLHMDLALQNVKAALDASRAAIANPIQQPTPPSPSKSPKRRTRARDEPRSDKSIPPASRAASTSSRKENPLKPSTPRPVSLPTVAEAHAAFFSRKARMSAKDENATPKPAPKWAMAPREPPRSKIPTPVRPRQPLKSLPTGKNAARASTK
ncbi:hypothetical protein C8Q79DRAFT_970295 [Trametes meyenii]|nr:hypothetical protein C8Q79DRAFT_970295 [Trametes meyenii]